MAYRYNEGSDLIEIKIMDTTGRVLEKWTVSTSNVEKYQQTINNINRKYGFNLLFQADMKKFIEDAKPLSDMIK